MSIQSMVPQLHAPTATAPGFRAPRASVVQRDLP